MSKAFLSHSSKDKGFVKGVADALGSALCHYDERTFEPTGDSADEILSALEDSEVFVLFLSANSLNSPWVQKEIKYARHMFFEGKITAVAIFPLDKTPRDTLEPWLRPFVVQTLMVQKLVGLRIRSMLIMPDTISSSRFIGRDSELSSLKSMLRDRSVSKPSAVMISGIGGIGKRRLLGRAYEDLYPFIPKHWVQIELGSYEGEAVLYERMLEYFEPLSDWAASLKKLEIFLGLTPAEKTLELARVFSEIEKTKQVVVLIFYNDIVNSDGNLEEWLISAIRASSPSYPVLAVSTVRGPGPRSLASISDIPYLKLNSIEDKDARHLFELLCDDIKVVVPESLTDQVVASVGGHPGLLELSAKLMKAAGAARFRIELSSSDGKSALEEYVEKALENVPLSDAEKSIILLVDELGGATPEDVLFGFTNDQHYEHVSVSLAKLLDYGMLEDSGETLRAASHLRLVIRRWKNHKALQDFLVPVRKNLVSILDQAQDIEGGSYLALRASIAAAIRENGEFSSVLVSKPLLAAQQLRVARKLYDERAFILAAEKAKAAFENRMALSDEGVVEALRILGLVGVRKNNDVLKEFSCTELDRISSGKTRKIAAFIRGFEKRLAGDFRGAEQQLMVALGNGGTGDFHVLRELAASLLEQGRAQEAEQYARGALRIAPTNPFIMDILVACLIDRFRDSVHDQGLKEEIRMLLARLASSDEREQQSFSPRREIGFAMASRRYPEAKSLLDKQKKNSHKIWYRGLLAEWLLRSGESREALITLDGLHRPPQNAGADEELLEFALVRTTKVLALAGSGRFDEAINDYNRNARFLSLKSAEELRKILVEEIARAPGVRSQAVRDFAKR
ncbi:TIR domain-containing protein [Pseudomonas sp. KFB-139]|uniref:TIR domain-containing protein n=1 Tax=Pseudomonas serbiensis TaxID=3064350 RepID=A0ABT9CLB7_9PSED|nr:TIR domain-containing protein [Pseudomonas sp. KFB-138]MDO7926258.1 TIR domain-containing protein [Pseudomonas sp. KFB-138]